MTSGQGVDFHTIDGVAIVTISNPPVNALSTAIRKGLMSACERIEADAALKAAVITSEGALFSGGADIREFDRQPAFPILPDVINGLTALGKPVVAAINGSALGGGYELALGCTARIAVPGAKLGLPEIKLGLIPGAGGTQRLPRLIGAAPAFLFMLKGEPVVAADALRLGMIDEVVEREQLLHAAIAEALSLAATADAAEPEKLHGENGRDAFETAAAAAAKEHRGSPNAAALIEAVRAAFDQPLEEGLALERQLFLKLKDDERSKALRYGFFAERIAGKVDNLPAGTLARPIKQAAVIGAGTMGTGIAICFINAGLPVTVIETSEDALTRGIERIKATFEDAVRRGKSSREKYSEQLALLSSGLSLEAAADADIVVEAVFEELALKKEIFAKLDSIAKPGAILATNTSYLNINEIASATSRPQDVLGLHFFSPANIMRLLEIVRAEKTSPDVLHTSVELAPKLGKVPVVVGVCHGFVGNRMLARRSQQGEALLAEGALPQDVDAAMVEFGFRMGPFAVGDLAGLDIGWRIRKATGASAPVSDALCALGRFGQKSGKGFYAYPSGARTGVPDPEVEALIKDVSARLGIERRVISSQEIVERLIFPMVNEGARILSEGIAARASDIDVIWTNGYGWPAWRGGPMYYADQVGLPEIAAKLQEFASRSGNESLLPSPALLELVKSGRKFAEVFA